MLVVPGAWAQSFTPAAPVFGKGPVPFALLRQAWIEDLEAQRLLSSAGHYAPDASVLSPDGNHVEGATAIRQFYTALFSGSDVAVALTSRVTSESGELAYDSGGYIEDLTDRATHSINHVHGDYLTVYRRSGLQWLIVQQAFTIAPAGPQGNAR